MSRHWGRDWDGDGQFGIDEPSSRLSFPTLIASLEEGVVKG